LIQPRPKVLSLGAQTPAMEIFVPFLQMLERYNGMTMTPAPEKPVEAPAEDPFADAFEIVARPKLTLVANR
jgi:hypothetical protein